MRARAHAAHDDVVVDEAAPAPRIDPLEDRVRPVRGGGDHALGDGLRQRLQDHVHDALLHHGAGAGGGGRPRVEERAFGRPRPDRPHGPGVLRQRLLDEGGLDGMPGVGERVVEGAVHPRPRLRARPLEVDGDLVAVHDHRHEHPERVGAPATVVVEVLRRVLPGRHFPDGGAHLPLGVREDLVPRREDRLRPVALEQLGEPQLADAPGVAHGLEVALHDLGHPHVAGDQAHHLAVHLAAAPEPGGQDADALLVELADPLDGLGARRRPAHVDLVRAVDDEADEPVAVEHRRRGAGHRRHDPGPVGRRGAPGPPLALQVGEEPAGLGVVVGDLDAGPLERPRGNSG